MGGLEIEEFAADQEIGRDFQCNQLGAQLVSVTRVINAKGRPVAYLAGYSPMNILSQTDLKKVLPDRSWIC